MLLQRRLKLEALSWHSHSRTCLSRFPNRAACSVEFLAYADQRRSAGQQHLWTPRATSSCDSDADAWDEYSATLENNTSVETEWFDLLPQIRQTGSLEGGARNEFDVECYHQLLRRKQELAIALAQQRSIGSNLFRCGLVRECSKTIVEDCDVDTDASGPQLISVHSHYVVCELTTNIRVLLEEEELKRSNCQPGDVVVYRLSRLPQGGIPTLAGELLHACASDLETVRTNLPDADKHSE